MLFFGLKHLRLFLFTFLCFRAPRELSKNLQTEKTEEQKAYVAATEAKKRQRQAAMGGDEEAAEAEETTIFHGEQLYDYQGRSFMAPPSDLNTSIEGMKCYAPKKHLHTWSGHSKAVSAIRFFPVTGHLLLSASMDRTMKIWSVGRGYKCLRTYAGHAEGIRDICWNNDGSRFMSCSFDKYIKYWDTETGQVISRHTSKQVPLCVKIHPDADKQHEVLVGQKNKLIVQWDLRTKELVQEYNEHLGAVNAIQFIDENRRFVSSSDDKKIFIWEYGIPVCIKHISEPDMHSMPALAVHPSGKFFVGQSQDNQILCFTAQNRYKLKRVSRNNSEKKQHKCLSYCFKLY